MPRTLVTGGAGFIGSNLVAALIDDEREVRVLDDLSSGRRENLGSLPVGSVELIEASILDPVALARAVDGVERVVHLAAIASVEQSMSDPLGTHAVNATGTLCVLEAARVAGVARVVCASSAAVYGEDPTLPKQEAQPPAPRSPYAAAKLAGEAYARAYSETLGLEVVSLRFFNVYGPLQDPASPYSAAIPIFVDRLLRGLPPIIFGDGRQTRDFVFVGDVVRALRLACSTPGVAGQVINVASGVRTGLLAVLDGIAAALDVTAAPIHEAPRPGDLRDSVADVSRARALLGFEAEVELRDGLSRTVAWLRGEAPEAVR